MFRHVVLYRVRPDLGAEARERLEALITSLSAGVPGILELQAGANVGPVDYGKGYDWGFCMGFADRRARDDYMRHPLHVRTAGAIEELVEDLVVLGLEG
jgi:stress responsive alpha/beta barrel protein